MPDDRSASFEGSLTRLEQIVKSLETEEPDLERAVLLYKEGKELVGRCEGLLRDAQTAIDAVNAPPPAATANGNTGNGNAIDASTRANATPPTSAMRTGMASASAPPPATTTRAVEDALDDDEIPL